MEKYEIPGLRNFDAMIKNSMIQMIAKYPLKSISEIEICEELKLNVATFYRYYLDVFDLLEKTENTYFRYFRKHMRFIEINSISDYIREYTNYLYSENATCVLAFGKYGNVKYAKRLFDLKHDILIEFLKDKTKIEDKKDLEYLYSYVIYSFTGVFSNWMANKKDKSASELIEFLDRMSNNLLENYK